MSGSIWKVILKKLGGWVIAVGSFLLWLFWHYFLKPNLIYLLFGFLLILGVLVGVGYVLYRTYRYYHPRKEKPLEDDE